MRRRWSRTNVFVGLMIASALTSLLPARMTNWMRAVVTPLTWVTWGASTGSAAARNAIGDTITSPSDPDDYRRLAAENEELRRQLQHQALRIAGIQTLFEQLSGLPDQLRDEQIRVLVATVTGGDSDPRRATLRISAGSLRGVREGDWVAAGRVVGAADGDGREMLQRHWLIGRVSHVERYWSTVQLTTDVGFRPTPVWVARVTAADEPEIVDRAALLEGLGDGRMVIRGSTLDPGQHANTIVLAPLGTRIPTPLAVGSVIEGRLRRESPLHYDLLVAPLGDTSRLTHVFIPLIDR